MTNYFKGELSSFQPFDPGNAKIAVPSWMQQKTLEEDTLLRSGFASLL
jgi:hypothetical protein